MNEIWQKILLFIFLTLLREFPIMGHNFNDEHKLVKRMMDLESCLGQFDVHRNMIIRTEESLAIGGKYLQGIALDVVEECRRLCCETDGCDVFIFEEKSEGYCYLFECGPPENFRCKFTKHGNFTSAVLTPIRHMTQPATIKPSQQISGQISQIQLSSTMNIVSQQERELTNLKQKLENPKDKISTTLAPINSITTHKIGTSNCGRFQFQCHSGECIGIYNACNGIPQCEDGSDEGPECSVENTITPSKSQMAHNNNVNNDLAYNENMLIAKDRSVSKQSVIQTMPRQFQPQIIQNPMINNREDPMSAPQIWPNRKVSVTQAVLEPNIFSHSGGIQLPSNNLPQFSNSKPNVIYNQIPNHNIGASVGDGMYIQPTDLQNPYRQLILQPQEHIISPNVNWPAQQSQKNILPENSIGVDVHGQLPKPQSPTAIKITQEAIETTNNVEINAGKTDEVSANFAAPGQILPMSNNEVVKENIKQEVNSKESDEYTDYTETSTEPPKKKQRKHKKLTKDGKKDLKKNKTDQYEKSVNNLYHGQYRIIKENLEMEFVDHDGYSERPGGAVLSLTLGVLVAAALAILIGCRMRTVGRRVRRLGKTTLANDADFLVNGMYL